MNKPTIIFDFDGTLADTFQLVIDILNENPKDFGIDGIDQDEIKDFKSQSLGYLLKEFKMHFFLIPLNMIKVRNRLHKKADQIKLFDGIKDLILDLEKNYNLAIVSGSDPKLIRRVLEQNDVNHAFKIVIGSVGAFGKDTKLIRFIKKNRLDRKKVLYVGDEIRDIESAKDAKIKSCAVTWGFNITEALEKRKPDFLVNSVEELREVIQKL